VSDLTLLSKISNEAINDNLKLRFEHDEIYVRDRLSHADCGVEREHEYRLTGDV
jgi:hypothetical protein